MPTLALNESVKKAVEISQSLAKEYRNEYFYPAHLLRSLLHKDVGLKNFLDSIGKDSGYVTEWAEVRMEDYPKIAQVKEKVTGDDGVKQVFEEADNVRIKLGLDFISPICLLCAISKPGIGFTNEQLKTFPVKEKEILEVYFKEDGFQQAVAPPEANGKAPAGALHKYCVERTALARENKTDPIIGRDRETRMMMEILCRRTKPNVIVTGESGVGKTALIDGLALDIVNKRVPAQLEGSLIFELDLGALIAGASYKGEIEDRLKNIIKEVKQFPKAIIFIDEIHILLDNKGSIGGGAANLLKPELARGEITVIGATTNDEYRKIIEPDQAFTRRFEVLQVLEPDSDTAIKMLNCLAFKFEDHHHLKIEADAIRECVRLAKRYIKDRRLPDAAIDLLDRTMAAIKLMTDTNENELAGLASQLKTLQQNEQGMSEPDLFGEYKWLNSVLNAKISPVLLGKLEDASQTDKFETATEFENFLHTSIDKLVVLAASKKRRSQ